MTPESIRRVCFILLGVLLIPTAYGMYTSNFLLAGVCVVGIVILRFVGLKRWQEELRDEESAGEDKP